MSRPDLTALAPANGADWEKQAAREALAFGVNKWQRGAFNLCDNKRCMVWATFPPSMLRFQVRRTLSGEWIEYAPTCPIDLRCAGMSRFFPELPTVLARGLVRLGFDSAPIESYFNLTITAHERLEWTLEMKARGFEVPKT